MAFVHLHTHSEYSLLDGANRIPELLDRIQALGMDSLAITDHGNLHGAWQFHAEALIGLAACLSGEIALYLRQGNHAAAKASAQYFARLFGPDGFWLEVQNHGLAEERTVAAGMFQLAAELGLPVVATNDAHYLKKEDAEAHDVLL